MQRISVVSLNLWNTEYWEERKACVTSFVQTYAADVYCFQEVRPQTLALLDDSLHEYVRIEGEEEGWRCENSIYLRKDRFKVDSFGRVDLKMPEVHRGLFWVKVHTNEAKPLFIGTMHLTHQLNADELRTGIGYRHAEAHLAARALNELAQGDAALICGDFNDPVHPSWIFHEQAGFSDVFTLLGLAAPVTFPCPYLSSERFLVEAIDKIMIKGPIRPVLATSPQFMTVGSALSDHWPVAAVLDL